MISQAVDLWHWVSKQICVETSARPEPYKHSYVRLRDKVRFWLVWAAKTKHNDVTILWFFSNCWSLWLEKNMLPLLPGLCCGSYMENSWSHRSSILACLIVKPSLWLFPGSKSRCQLQFFFPSRSNLSQHKTYVWFLKLGGISSYYSKFKTYSKRPSLGVFTCSRHHLNSIASSILILSQPEERSGYHINQIS